MSFLGSLPSDQKLAIVTCVGPVGSGKSFFAGRLVENDCFPMNIGVHESSKTLGI